MFEQTFKNLDNVLWKEAGGPSELDYTERTSWLPFLKYLDALAAETRHLEVVYQRKLDALAELKQSLLQRAFAWAW